MLSAFAVVMFLAGETAAAPASLDQLERLSVGGHEYVRVRDWAGANGLAVAWVRPGKSLRVAGGAGSVVLTDDSRTALVNGISVWLSFPVVVREDKAWVALLDVKTAIAPLLFPARGAGAIRLVALDPGHGGKDKGHYERKLFEKDCTLLLAREVRDQLSRAGLKATLTRATDAFIELEERPAVARRRRADLLVSLHFNAAGPESREAKGVEVYCATPAGASSTNVRGNGGSAGVMTGNVRNDGSVLLAYHLQRSLVTRLGLEDRGVRRARFEVLRLATMPAVLIEGGFLTHPSEGRRIVDPGFRRQMAKAIVEGLLNYRRAVEPERERQPKRSPA